MSARRWRRPAWWAIVLTLVGMAVFARLGVWQLHRADEKQQLLSAFANAPKAAFEDFASVRDNPPENRYAHVRVYGRFVADRGYLRDEQVRNSGLGIEVYAPFAPADGTAALLLVDRGWIAWTHERGTQPALPPLAEGEVELEGIYAPFPGSGIRLGGNALAAQSAWPKLTLAIDAHDIAADLGPPLLPHVLLLDADASSGFLREWTPNLIPPERHRAYAWQWFAFAFVAPIIFILLHYRKVEDS